jgi:hypothetical protein
MLKFCEWREMRSRNAWNTKTEPRVNYRLVTCFFFILDAAAQHVETAPSVFRHGIEQTLARAALRHIFVVNRAGIKKLEFRYKEATQKVE